MILAREEEEEEEEIAKGDGEVSEVFDDRNYTLAT